MESSYDSQTHCKIPLLIYWLKEKKRLDFESIREDAISHSDSVCNPSCGYLELMKGGVFELFFPHIFRSTPVSSGIPQIFLQEQSRRHVGWNAHPQCLLLHHLLDNPFRC